MNVVAAILLASTSLHIAVWPNGEGRPPKRSYTLTCAPVGGSLPRRAAACRRLAQLNAPFAGVPKNRACAEIYGGRQEAFVTGRFRGALVHVRFNRRDGCQIERWNRVGFLFPAT